MFDWINIDILDRLARRLALVTVTTVQRPFQLLHQVLPVLNMDRLLQKIELDTKTGLDLSGAGGHVTAFTVPQGKRWTLIGWQTSATAAGSVLSISDGTVRYQLTGSVTAASIENDRNIPLDENWTIDRGETGNGGDVAESLSILYLEEDWKRE